MYLCCGYDSDKKKSICHAFARYWQCKLIKVRRRREKRIKREKKSIVSSIAVCTPMYSPHFGNDGDDDDNSNSGDDDDHDDDYNSIQCQSLGFSCDFASISQFRCCCSHIMFICEGAKSSKQHQHQPYLNNNIIYSDAHFFFVFTSLRWVDDIFVAVEKYLCSLFDEAFKRSTISCTLCLCAIIYRRPFSRTLRPWIINRN